MPHLLQFSIAVVLAFLAGGVPFGLIAGKVLKGIDIRDYGSGNLGATNVARTLGKPAGAVVLLLDALKGWLPVKLLPLFLAPPDALAPWFPEAVALAAVCGHVWPVYLRFRGGKGVAVSLGALLALSPPVLGVGAAVFLAAVLLTRWISLGSVLGALAAAVSAWILPSAGRPLAVFVSLLAVLVVVRHRANIRRILAGTERRFGEKITISPAREDEK